MGIMVAGQQAAMGKFLAFSRVQESIGRCRGRRLSRQGRHQRQGHRSPSSSCIAESRISPRYPAGPISYGRPTRCRRAHSRARAIMYQASPDWNKPTDPALEERFQRVKAKLIGLYRTIRPRRCANIPETQPEPSRRAMRAPMPGTRAPIRKRRWTRSSGCSRSHPHDPYFLELKGQILLEFGQARRKRSRRCARRCSVRASQPLIAALFGHALIATEDPTNFDEARTVLKRRGRARPRQSLRLVSARHRL